MATATATPAPADMEPTTPHQVQDDALYEMVQGRILEKPSMGAYPTWIASLLAQALGAFATAQQRGRVVVEMLFRLDANVQRRPDVAFVSYERWPRGRRISDEAAWDVVPDLAIEVVSPTNSANDVITKLDEYFRAGVQRVWVVYPNAKTIYLYESPTVVKILRGGDTLDGAPLLPGFVLPLAALFEDEQTG